jgi:hypothetical protein
MHTDTSPDQRPAKRRAHLLDLDAPRPAYDPDAERKLTQVQRWVMSTLAVTTILHLVFGLIVAAVTLDDPAPGARVGLNVIAGACGVFAVAAALGIHQRRLLSGWLLIGFVPMVVGLWLTLS